MDKITVTGFRWVPLFAQGLVRDLRVRWALEEAGLRYEAQSIELGQKDSPEYRRQQPFGLVPAFEADGRQLFESGAIVHQIAMESEALMPPDPAGRADTLAWMFAALNTVEPPIQNLSVMDLQQNHEPWVKLRRPGAVDAVKTRLTVLAGWLDGRDYLLDRFSAADVLMATVLRLIRHTDIVAEFPVVDAYLRRCEARPAFQRALNSQLAAYAQNIPVAA
ncbi:glutathione S-transferase family protein [Sphingomonas sp. So64.6b]|uniref:glutathione S-transferase family protein n=1 Tax=Sphingomonas sp. So64.6b TaxID=2997354 RepID=UPI0016040EF2|nr:glutathione S-transferase family protein [Sphingomonas sp. So64.6b]QNA84696.1 glutathione S-transferase family protein [Sphingomonas sp. So64.6b]